MQILDGKAVSTARRNALKLKIQAFTTKANRPPHLVVVLVGSDPASQVYVRNKIRACEEVGMRSTKLEFPAVFPQEALNATIEKLNSDPGIDGILVQLPLPKPLSEDSILGLISPLKDADAFSYQSLGMLWAGQSPVAPCTPQGVMSILEHYRISVAGKRAVVVGRSNIVGKPMAHLLTSADATVTICHSKTVNLREHTSQADICVVAAGKPRLLGRDDFKKDSVIIDVGIHGSGAGSKICGDVRFEELEGWVKAATPVPGGVGPMTITTLLENTLALATKRMQIS